MDRDKRSVWRGASLLGVVGILGVTLLLAGGAAAQGAYPIIYNRTPASAGLSYWTPERMAAAIPKEMSLSGETILPAVAPVPAGPPGAAGGGRPGQLANEGPGLLLEQRGNAAPIPADGASPGPHDTFEYFPRYTKHPISTIGKLFFTEPGVGNFICSVAVTSGSAGIQNIIWTAGHCVANGGQAIFYTNWLFCPAYDSPDNSGCGLYGSWTWAFVATSSEWFNNGAFTRDYAIIGLVHCGSKFCTDVGNVTGSLGFAWNLARDQHWIHLGYPQAAPYSGGKIIATATEHRYDDMPDLLGPPTNSWGSSQTAGSSGSAVIKGFFYGSTTTPPVSNPNGSNLINSNVSYGYDNLPGELYGPYFDTQVCNFWKLHTGWPGTC